MTPEQMQALRAQREAQGETLRAELRAGGEDRDAGPHLTCDAAIPVARLRAQPAAARCISCQELQERAHPAVVRALPAP